MGEKINQSALNNILFKITSYDEHASSAYEIDSQKEVDRLGSYLNGDISPDVCKAFGLPTKEELDKDENKDIYEYLKNLYDSVKDKFTTPKGKKSISDIETLGKNIARSSTKKIDNDKYTETVNAITKDNVSDINPTALENLSSNYYLSKKKVKDNKIEAGQKLIEEQLLAKAAELGVSQDAIDEATSKKDIGFEVYVRYLTKAIQKKENEIAEKNEIDKAEEYEKEKEKDKLTVPSTEKDANSPQAKLQNACNAYVKENGIKLNDQGRRNDFGDHRNGYNGEIEVGGATQKKGNCWLMAGLNSVAAVEQNASSDSNETEETTNTETPNSSTETSTNTSSGTETESEIDTNSEKEPNTGAGANSETGANVETDTSSESDDNSMTNTNSETNQSGEETSVSLSENIYRDQKHGLTAVRLPEAAAKGKGYNGEGIYFVPDNAANSEYTEGDLDAGAYNSAVAQYFNETGEDTDVNISLRDAGFEVSRLDGNTLSRAFEIMSGKQTVKKPRLCADSNSIVTTDSVTHKDVVDTYKAGAAIVLGMRGKDLGLGEYVNHAFSVVGVDEKSGNVILQESNNSPEIAGRFKKSDVSENEFLNIVVTPDEFGQISFSGASAMKVK